MNDFNLKIDGREVKGPLQGFIRKKLSSFKEPERRGTLKGDPIGFGLSKYLCALYSLTNLNQKEISEQLKVSYGVLRKWNWEEPFKEKVKDLVDEFANELLGRYVKEQIAINIMTDSEHYGDRLRARLMDGFMAHIDKKRLDDDSPQHFLLIHCYLQLTTDSGKRMMGGNVRKQVRETDRLLFDRLTQMLKIISKKKRLAQFDIQVVDEIISLLGQLYSRLSREVVQSA